MSCCAYGCTNRKSKNIPGITFHRFPVHEERRAEWIKAIRRENWIPSPYTRICSAHFKPELFDRSMKKVVLKENAVPTIFESFPSYLQNKTNARPPPTERPEPVAASGNESSVPSPTKSEYKRRLEEAQEREARQLKKIKVLRQTVRRSRKKVGELKSLIEELRKNHLMNDSALDILAKAAAPNKEFLNRQLAKAQSESLPSKYSEELRAFALTLHFYSPRAYSFVREQFNLCLPHPRTLSKWYEQIEGVPGFTAEAVKTLQEKVSHSDHELLFALSMDEMAIRRQVTFDGKSFHGYVNMGVEINDDELPIAKDALVFMLTCINEKWKIPVGYFFVDAIDAPQRANLVMQCLTLLHSANVRVVSLTFDGLASNMGMARQLGCNFSSANFCTTFKHPISEEEIAVLLDPPHMLKLVRNALGEKGTIIDGDGMVISWKYVKELVDLQEKEGLHLGNKLRSNHVNFGQNKMKVSLAAQVLSKSCATAIDFCNKVLRLSLFLGSEATVKFIMLFNDLYDILNSRSLKQVGWKKAACAEQWEYILSFLNDAFSYIGKLRCSTSGDFIIQSNRKVGFLGFQICIKSMIVLVEKHVLSSSAPLKYLPMHKLSQDHVELFFACIRLKGGWNNNPTAQQFSSAYKKLLVNSQIGTTGNGNCLPLSAVSIMSVSSSVPVPKPVELINVTTKANEIMENVEYSALPDYGEHDYLFLPHALSLCAENVVYYISGFVARKLMLKLRCVTCVNSLFILDPDRQRKSLICYKDKGFLVYPSNDVFKICKICETHFRRSTAGGLSVNSSKILKLKINILQDLLTMELFRCLNDHSMEFERFDNHLSHLIHAVVDTYLSARIKHFTKSFVSCITSKRQLYNELVLLQGQ